jgi:D-alanyl-lipoteichoic acid acyltransferase DltB (MBOAT superfamily)
MPPTRSLLDYAIFVAFFPALPAGPMDRARRLLSQIAQPRRVSSAQVAAGWYLVLWGLYKKLVIADNLAKIVDPVFQDPSGYAGLDILLAVLAFGVQIYSDFSGYSDIARGLAKMLGFELTVNFRLPFFALNPADFWQRWHISFSEWLRDYIFFPLRRALLKMGLGRAAQPLASLPEVLPPLLTMLASGLWHGAGWTFLLWGGYHGLLMVLYRLFEKRPIHQGWRSGQPLPRRCPRC